MRIISILMIASLASLSSALSQPLAMLDSQIEWKGKAAFNAYALSGTLELEKATLFYQDETLSQATILIDMGSIQSENDRLVQHLKSKDFFEVKRYRLAQFTLDAPIPMKVGATEVQGQLQIKAVSHPIRFPIELVQVGEKWEMTGKMIIDRTKYGITFNSPTYFEKLKEQAIADEFELTFRLVVKQGQQAMR